MMPGSDPIPPTLDLLVPIVAMQPLQIYSPGNSRSSTPSSSSNSVCWHDFAESLGIHSLSSTPTTTPKSHSTLRSQSASIESLKTTDYSGTMPSGEVRIKGVIYVIKGMRKKWDGKRFARCCIFCDKLAQGGTDCCKSHGYGTTLISSPRLTSTTKKRNSQMKKMKENTSRNSNSRNSEISEEWPPAKQPNNEKQPAYMVFL